MAGDHVFNTTDENFKRDVLDSDQPVLVDFWATWCGPCRALSPVIDEVAGDFAGKAKVFKVNTDESPNTPAQYGVRGIPTVILFKNGEVVDQSTGAHPKNTYVEMLNKAL